MTEANLESVEEIDSEIEEGEIDSAEGSDEGMSFEDFKAQEYAELGVEDTAEEADPIEEPEDEDGDKEEVEEETDDSKEEESEEDGDKDKEDKDSSQGGEIEYKVDGEVHKIAMSDVPNMLAKAAGADARFQEASNIRKEAVEFVDFIKSSPIEALKRAGIDFEELAVQHVYDKFQYEELDDAGRTAFDNNKELEQLRSERDQFQKKDDAAEIEVKQRQDDVARQERVAQAEEALGNEIMGALESSTVPKNKFTISRMAMYMQEGATKGLNLSAKDVLSYVEGDYKEMIEEARKADVKAYKSTPKKKPSKVSSPGRSKKPTKRFTSVQDMLE